MDQGIASGQTATLWVTATGTAPFSYQWYQGNPGDTSHPAGSSASSFTTPVLTTNASYWVRVSNACGQADSAAATVWVGPTYLYSTWLPVGGEVGGLNDSLWQRDAGVLNTSAGTANVLAKSYGTGGIGSDSAQFVVEPYNQAILSGLATEVSVNGLGAIQLLSDQPLRITTRTYNHVEKTRERRE
jgi:hypothetical protein